MNSFITKNYNTDFKETFSIQDSPCSVILNKVRKTTPVIQNLITRNAILTTGCQVKWR